MNLFQKGYQQLANDLINECGINVSVYRNGVALQTFNAVPVTTQFDDIGSDGKNILLNVTSFSVKISENYTPLQGDILVTGNGERYEVRPIKDGNRRYKLEGSNLYRRDDLQGSLIIVHAQKVL